MELVRTIKICGFALKNKKWGQVLWSGPALEWWEGLSWGESTALSSLYLSSLLTTSYDLTKFFYDSKLF